MISVIFLLVLALVVVAFLIVVALLAASLGSPSTRRWVKVSAFVLLLILFLGPTYWMVRIVPTPTPNEINDRPSVFDGSGQLLVQSLRMFAPIYKAGQGTLEKVYANTVIIDAENTSNQTLYLGIESYANGGAVAGYSPGAMSSAHIVEVPANWSGELRFPIRHVRFVKGGSLHITLATCQSAQNAAGYLPSGSQTFCEKEYVMVPDQD